MDGPRLYINRIAIYCYIIIDARKGDTQTKALKGRKEIKKTRSAIYVDRERKKGLKRQHDKTRRSLLIHPK